MFTMRQPLSGLQTVGVVVGVLFSLLSLSRQSLPYFAALVVSFLESLYLVFHLALICCVKQCDIFYK